MARNRLASLGILVGIALCSLVSCKQPEKPGPPPQTNSGRAAWGRGTDKEGKLRPGVDFAVVQYVTWDGRIVFALWTDLGGAPDSFPNDLSSFLHPNRAGAEGRYGGSLQEKSVPGAPVIEYSAVTDGSTGSATVAGQKFDLAEGFLVLVSTADNKVQTKQVKRDHLKVSPSGTNVEVAEALQQLKADPEIVAFFARPVKQK